MNNNQAGPGTTVAGFVGGTICFLVMVAYAVVTFVAIGTTILALVACVQPLKLGRVVITQHQARMFLVRGFFGACLVTAFAVWFCVLFDIWLYDEVVPYLVLGGYSLGSVGGEIVRLALDLDDEPASPPQIQHQPPTEPQIPPARQAEEPFRYANWIDEEARQ